MGKQKLIFLLFSVFLATFFVFLIVYSWQSPNQSPPEGNVSAPLNVGPQGQAKAGGLILNTGGAPIGLIVQEGNVGIGTTNPTQKLDVAGYVKGTGLCIGSDCRTSWPSGGVNQVWFSPTVEQNNVIKLGNPGEFIYCSLSYIYRRSSKSESCRAGCQVYLESNQWKLKSITTNTEHCPITCQAVCFK